MDSEMEIHGAWDGAPRGGKEGRRESHKNIITYKY